MTAKKESISAQLCSSSMQPITIRLETCGAAQLGKLGGSSLMRREYDGTTLYSILGEAHNGNDCCGMALPYGCEMAITERARLMSHVVAHMLAMQHGI